MQARLLLTSAGNVGLPSKSSVKSAGVGVGGGGWGSDIRQSAARDYTWRGLMD